VSCNPDLFNEVTAQGFASAFEDRAAGHLQQLKIDGCGLNEQGVQHLAQVLSMEGVLPHLWLVRIGEDFRDILREGCVGRILRARRPLDIS